MSPTAIVYPLYFDSKRSAGDGRKVALSRSIPSPKLAHLVTAAKKLNLQYSVQVSKSSQFRKQKDILEIHLHAAGCT